jgi:hypothetical protein
MKRFIFFGLAISILGLLISAHRSDAATQTPLQKHLTSLPRTQLTPLGQAIVSGLAVKKTGVVSTRRATTCCDGIENNTVPEEGAVLQRIDGGWMYNEVAGGAVYYPYGFSVPVLSSWGGGAYALFVVGPGFYNGYGRFEHMQGFWNNGPENVGWCPHPVICEVYAVAPGRDAWWRVRGITFWSSSNLFYFEYSGAW